MDQNAESSSFHRNLTILWQAELLSISKQLQYSTKIVNYFFVLQMPLSLIALTVRVDTVSCNRNKNIKMVLESLFSHSRKRFQIYQFLTNIACLSIPRPDSIIKASLLRYRPTLSLTELNTGAQRLYTNEFFHRMHMRNNVTAPLCWNNIVQTAV